jgi:hypothetical protein
MLGEIETDDLRSICDVRFFKPLSGLNQYLRGSYPSYGYTIRLGLEGLRQRSTMPSQPDSSFGVDCLVNLSRVPGSMPSQVTMAPMPCSRQGDLLLASFVPCINYPCRLSSATR